jgi:predicted metalloenzyme YecM
MLTEQLSPFESRLTDALEVLGSRAVCETLSIDHACVRFRDPHDVDALRIELRSLGTEISSVIVNGRIISIFELQVPILLGSWKVFGIEVPYPKPDHRYVDGWEHVEFVLTNTANTMGAVRDSCTTHIIPHIALEKFKQSYEYEEDEPSAPDDQIPNPTIGLKVNGIGIKFHARPIQEVVGYV